MANLLARWGRTQLFPAYVKMYDDGSVVVSPNGSTTHTLTSAVLGGLTKLSGFVYDLTGATTGAAYVSITDALAESWVVKVGSTALQTYVTTANKVRVRVNVPLTLASAVAVNVTSAAKVLVFGASSGNNVALTSNLIAVQNTSGSAKNLTLPPIADLAGFPLFIFVGGNAGVDVKDSGGGAIGSIAANKGAVIYNDGTDWAIIAGA